MARSLTLSFAAQASLVLLLAVISILKSSMGKDLRSSIEMVTPWEVHVEPKVDEASATGTTTDVATGAAVSSSNISSTLLPPPPQQQQSQSLLSSTAPVPGLSSIQQHGVGNSTIASSTSTGNRTNFPPHKPYSISKPDQPWIVVAGAAKNVASSLGAMKRVLDHLNARYNIVRVVIFENDSTDGTVQAMKQWFENYKVDIISEVGLKDTRTVVLAHARNRLWEEIRKVDEPFDYVLMMDMDHVNKKLRNMEECWNLPEDWTVCCVNTRNVYYDLWALRTRDDWIDFDVAPLSKQDSMLLFRHISAAEPPIRVNSCFNGAALYHYQQLKDLNLDGYRGYYPGTNQTMCEHVAFHESLIQQDPSVRLYIQTKWLNQGKGRSQAVRQRLASQIKASHENPDVRHFYSVNGY